MQLFTIGLWELDSDGSRKKDEYGQDIPTYSNENVMDFARVFTGFTRQAFRANLEIHNSSRNINDPMNLKGNIWHDWYPKMDLGDDYIGDVHPLCEDLRQQSSKFLIQNDELKYVSTCFDAGLLWLLSHLTNEQITQPVVN